MEEDYECPRCHNKFPSYNKFLHNIKCTEQKPFPLNQNIMMKSKNNEKKAEIKPNILIPKNFEKKEELLPKNIDLDNIIKDIIENDLKDYPPLGDFPDVFECDIWHEILKETDRNDHMYCHNLEKEERNRDNNVNNNSNRIGNIDIYTNKDQ